MSTASNTQDYARFDELAEEFAERFRRGERPSVEEYVARLPGMADEIREMFAALVEVERAEREARGHGASASALGGPRLAQVGDYRLLREIGRGGMGVVYEAEQISLGRRVALKVLPDQVAGDRKALERFRREAKAAARLHHTNIVPVFEVGREGGVAFYAMQFIHGESLDQVIKALARLRKAGEKPVETGAIGPASAAPLVAATASFARDGATADIPERPPSLVARLLLSGEPLTRTLDEPAGDSAIADRGASNTAVLPGGTPLSAVETSRRRLPYFRSVAQLGRQAAQGLAYAHARGIVHRDVKPSNLLLDISGIVWITDFGLAKAGDDGLTATGDLLGTLRYIAPERFRGEGDARADIYALGLTLYELLTLRPAFDSSDRLKLIDQIQTEEPARPRSIDSQIPRDLETIILKATDKDPGRRYSSAEGLAEDLRRFLDDEAILARPSTAMERLMKLARRRPAIAALSLALLAVAVIGLTGIVWEWRQALKNLDQANIQSGIAKDKSREAAEKADSLERQLYLNRIQLAHNEWSSNSSSAALDTLNRCPPELRNWEWSYLDRLCHLERLSIDGGQTGLAFSPDGKRVAAADSTHRIKIWDATRGDLIRTLTGHTNTVYAIAFSPDGRLLATGSRDTTIRLWDAATGSLFQTLEPHGSWIRSIAFSPDGSRLVSGSGAEQFTPNMTAELILWEVASGREIRRFAGPHDRIYGVAYRPDGKQIASVNCESSLKLWDPETGALSHRLEGHTDYINCVAYSSDGRTLATGGRDHVAILWDVAGAKILHALRGHDSAVADLDFSPDGKTLITADSDSAIKLWDVSRGAEIAHLRNSSGVVAICFGPDGKNIATVGYDSKLRLWDPATLESVEHRLLSGHRGWCYRAGYTPDGRILATAGWGVVRLWNASTGQHLRDVEMGFGSGVYAMAIGPDGRILATAQERGPTHVDLWDVASGQPIIRLEGHRATVKCVAFAPDGRTIASAGDDLTIRLWAPTGGRTIATLAGHTAAVDALAFSPDGKLLASQSLDNSVRIWELATGREVRQYDVSRQESYNCGVSLAFSPDGKYLAAARSDGLVNVWDVITGAQIRTLSGHRGPVNSVAFLGERRVVTTSDDRTVKLWDLATGESVLTLRGHSSGVIGLACRPDGSQLATTGLDGACVWDTSGPVAPARPDAANLGDRVTPRAAPTTPSLLSRSVLLGHQAQINRIAYAADGHTLVTVSDDKTIRLWETGTGRPRAVLSGHRAPVTSVAFAPDGRTFATGEGDWQRPHEPADLKLWDVVSGACIATWNGHQRPIWSLVFSRDGRTLASGSSDGLVKLWETSNHAERAVLNFGTGEWVRGLAITPDGKTLASSHQRVVRLWDVARRQPVADLKGHTEEITAMAISPDGTILATASRDQSVILWDLRSRRRLQSIADNQGWVNDVAFSPDGKTLAFGVMDGKVKLWDVAAARIKASGQVRNGSSLAVAFSPDGKTIASGHNPFVAFLRVSE
jgi:eukaryotic-like serine/threonine-protein kinase